MLLINFLLAKEYSYTSIYAQLRLAKTILASIYLLQLPITYKYISTHEYQILYFIKLQTIHNFIFYQSKDVYNILFSKF